MVAISFSKRENFPDLIRQGRKDQTIRPYNERRFEQINRIKKLQLYWKQRTKECYKIADAELTEILIIRFELSGIYIWNEKIKYYERDWDKEKEIIKRDGFDNKLDFYRCFENLYGNRLYDMEFMVIRWRLVKNG